MILGNSGRGSGEMNKAGKETVKGCVTNLVTTVGQLVLGPAEELWDRAKSMPGVISSEIGQGR